MERGINKNLRTKLKEFQRVCKLSGWSYVTKSRDLHICFKKKDYDAVALETDEDEKLEKTIVIGKRQILGAYIDIGTLLLATWFLLLGLFSYTDIIQNGLLQLAIPLIPLFLLQSIRKIIMLKKFIKINKNKLEIGKEIEYIESDFYFEKIMFLITLVLMIGLTIYTLYVGIKLKNTFVLFATIYIIVSLILFIIIGLIFRLMAKPTRENWFTQMIVVIIIVSLAFGINRMYILNLESVLTDFIDLDVEEYRVLRPNEPVVGFGLGEAIILQNTSLFVPLSYKYNYFDPDSRVYISSEYSNAINEDIANTLVDMYIRQAKRKMNFYKSDLEFAVEEDNYYVMQEMFENVPEDMPNEKSFDDVGLSFEEFDKIDKSKIKKGVKESMAIIKSKAISEDTEKLWNLEEVYFLSYDKREVVIREGKEVFYLEGKDFSDPEIIKIVKDKLVL